MREDPLASVGEWGGGGEIEVMHLNSLYGVRRSRSQKMDHV